MHKCERDRERCVRCGVPTCDVCRFERDLGDKKATFCAHCTMEEVLSAIWYDRKKIIKLWFFLAFFVANSGIILYIVISGGFGLSDWMNVLVVLAIVFGPIDALAIFLFKKVTYDDDVERYSDSWITRIMAIILAPIFCFVFVYHNIVALIDLYKDLKETNKFKSKLQDIIDGYYDDEDDEDDDGDEIDYRNANKNKYSKFDIAEDEDD